MEHRFKVALERIENLQDGKKGLSKSDVANFKAAFDALDADEKLFQSNHCNVILEDSSVDCLKAILLDTNEPEDVLNAIFYELCNRDDAIKLPMLEEVSSLADHPNQSDARELLSSLKE